MNRSFRLIIPLAVIFCMGLTTVGVSQPVTPPPPYAPGIPVNYIRTWQPVRPETNATNITIANNPQDFRMTTQYMDGLGRPLQVVSKKAVLNSYNPSDNPSFTPTSGDKVTSIVYDEYGRETTTYLPFASSSTDGLFKNSPFSEQISFYNTQLTGQSGETNVGINNLNWAYSQKRYEMSPLDRVTEAFAPGVGWVGSSGEALEANRRSDKIKFYSNTSVDAVRIWNVLDGAVGSWGSYSTPGIYPDGTLQKTITINAEGKQQIEFTDKEGRTILRKQQIGSSSDINGAGSSHSGWLCTYYIYDNLGRIRCVIQPKAITLMVNWTFTTDILAENCFRYEYDERNLMIIRKVPGAGEIYFVFDNKRRLVMTQDASQRSNNEWLVTKYDNLNRAIESGSWISSTSFAIHRANASLSGTYPTISGSYTVQTISHYDDYNSLPSGLTSTLDTYWTVYYLSATYNTAPDYAQPVEAMNQAIGKLTWTQERIAGTSNFLSSVLLYDSEGRLVQHQMKNITGGYDVQTFQYSWHGEVLMSVERTHDATASNPQSIVIVTKCSYDDLKRLVKLEKKISHNDYNGGTLPTNYSTVLTQEFDALGQVKRKTVGGKKNLATGTYYSPRQALQVMELDYNVRGWILGMNRDNLTASGPGTDTKLFGYELGFDKLTNKAGSNFAATQYSGNIAGVIWKSAGDNTRRKYDFSYDAASRLLKADYNQDDGTWGKLKTNFSVVLGTSGLDDNSAYDENGNIKRMQQWGVNLTGPTKIDDLTYFYFNGGNKLQEVRDAEIADYKIGDFVNKNTATTDYGYDKNGNMVTDLNKRLGGTTGTDLSSGGAIHYNYLNLPDEILIKDDAGTPKGKITYLYDGGGYKIKKTVEEYALPANGNIATITATTYINGLIFESKTVNGVVQYTNKLLFAKMEEGRIRAEYTNENDPNSISGLEYDYMIKDHLGNVRMVLTEQVKTIYYPAATVEGTYSPTGTAQAASMVNYEKQFYTIDPAKIRSESSIASWSPETTGNTKLYYNHNGNPPSNLSYPSGTTPIQTAGSNNLYLLNATSNRTGLEMVLKVMAGDKIDIFGKSYHLNTGPINNSNSTSLDLLSLMTNLLLAPSNGIAGKGLTAGQLNSLNTGIVPSMFFTGANNETTTVPKAYINYIFLDEQFRYAGGWASRVGSSGVVTDHWAVDVQLQNIVAPKNGYIFVYVSNESNVDVFFDNLQVVHKPGPILEETHYYPFGLTMSAISSKGLGFGSRENKYKFNSGTELSNKEFSDGSGLDWYEATFRGYDPQIGRFHQIDPLAEATNNWTPYAFCNNNPIAFTDPFGLDTTITINGNPVSFTDSEIKSWVTVSGSKPKKPSTPPSMTTQAGLPAPTYPGLYPVPPVNPLRVVPPPEVVPRPSPLPLIGRIGGTILATVLPVYGGLAPGTPYDPYAHIPLADPWDGHANDRRNSNPHIVYYFVYDAPPGQSHILKYGISDYLRYGQSRPENQIAKFRAKYGKSVYYVIYTRTTNQEQARFIEQLLVTQHWNVWGYMPIEQLRPYPFKGF